MNNQVSLCARNRRITNKTKTGKTAHVKASREGNLSGGTRGGGLEPGMKNKVPKPNT